MRRTNALFMGTHVVSGNARASWLNGAVNRIWQGIGTFAL